METTAAEVGAAAAIVVAVGIIWKKVVQPFLHSLQVLTTGISVLVEISQEFKSNGGSTLKDVVDSIKEDTANVRTELGTLRQDFDEHRIEDRENFAAAGVERLEMHNRQQRIELHLQDALRNQASIVETGAVRPNPPEAPG